MCYVKRLHTPCLKSILQLQYILCHYTTTELMDFNIFIFLFICPHSVVVKGTDCKSQNFSFVSSDRKMQKLNST